MFFFSLTVISKHYHFHNFSTSCTVSLLGDSVLQQHSRLLKSSTAKHYEVSIDIKTKSKVEIIISSSKYIWSPGLFLFWRNCAVNKVSQPPWRLQSATVFGFQLVLVNVSPTSDHVMLIYCWYEKRELAAGQARSFLSLPTPHHLKDSNPRTNIPLYGSDFKILRLLFHVYSICMHHTD